MLIYFGVRVGLQNIHHRGTEYTEKTFLLLTVPKAQLIKKNSVLSAPLW